MPGIYYIPGRAWMLHMYSVLTYFIVTYTLRYIFVHFTDEEIEAQRLRNLPRVRVVLGWDLNPGNL